MKRIICGIVLMIAAGCSVKPENVPASNIKIVCFTPNGDIMFHGTVNSVEYGTYSHRWFVELKDGLRINTNALCMTEISKVK